MVSRGDGRSTLQCCINWCRDISDAVFPSRVERSFRLTVEMVCPASALLEGGSEPSEGQSTCVPIDAFCHWDAHNFQKLVFL